MIGGKGALPVSTAVVGDFTGDRRWGPPQPGSDPTQRFTCGQPARDLVPLKASGAVSVSVSPERPSHPVAQGTGSGETRAAWKAPVTTEVVASVGLRIHQRDR
jgi:hypothetical protein